MRKIVLFSVIAVVLIALVAGCTETAPNNELAQRQKQLVVMVYDITGSTDKYSYLTEQDWDFLIKKVSEIGGGYLYGYHIKRNSLQQDPYRVSIETLDTLSYKDNIFLDEDIRVTNRKTIAEFEQKRQVMVDDALERFVKPKNESYSDVENALKLAKVDLDQPNFSEYGKSLIVISDLVEDTPRRKAKSTNAFSIEYGNDVKIILVRPSQSHIGCIKGQQPIIVNTIADAINNL
jgi:hypothetical protein